MNEPWTVPVTRGAAALQEGRSYGARTVHGADTAVLAFESADQGRTWQARGAIVRDPDPATDLGDGAFLESHRHGLLYVCRHNRLDRKAYAIRVHASPDGGRTWRPHSTVTGHTVTTAGDPSRGLWAPFLFEAPEGKLFCVYDDENLPLLSGFRGHQWLVGRFWDGRSWGEPVVVSRARDPGDLSRDGMATLVAAGKRLLCAFESVETAPPHANLIRWVASDDGGTTWSWRKTERGVLYRARPPYLALAPFLAKTSGGALTCAFCTDEDRPAPGRSGTAPRDLRLDIKAVTSRDQGTTWSAPETVYAGTHRNYLPGLVPQKDDTLALWIDFDRDRTLACLLGKPTS